MVPTLASLVLWACTPGERLGKQRSPIDEPSVEGAEHPHAAVDVPPLLGNERPEEAHRDTARPTADTATTAGGDPGLLERPSINELMSHNLSTITDASGWFEDWLELYNPNDVPIAMSGWTMTDNLDKPAKFALDAALVLPAGGFLLLWADGDPEEGPDHLGFRLSAAGEELGLFDAEGQPVDQVSFDALGPDVAAARIPDGGPTWELTMEVTPGSSNHESDP